MAIKRIKLLQDLLLILDSEWSLSADDWGVMSRCNKAGYLLFPYSSRQAEAWSLWAFQQYRTEGTPPEVLRDRRCPGIKELHARRPPNLLNRYRTL